VSGVKVMLITLSVIAVFFLISAWIRQLHLKEVNVNVKFQEDDENPKQLKK
jgi:hypothetical protein